MTDIGAFFDSEAARYDAAYDAPTAGGRVLRERLRVAVELLGAGRGEVLDVGMGAGRLCAELHGRGWKVSGIDVSQAMVEAARARLPELRDRLRVGSIDALPFAETTFDAVVATGVLEYAVEELDGATRELARVLRREGLAVVSFPNHGSPVHLLRGRVLYPLVRALKRVVPLGRPAPPALPLSSPRRLEEALAGAGLAVDVVRPVDVRWPGTACDRLARRCASQLVYAARRVA